MLQAIKDLLGMLPKTDYSELIKQGAIVLEVRGKDEFSGEHIKNSINIPVDQLSNNLAKLKDKNKFIICCFASGMRSGTDKRILESHGYKAVYNGGSWSGLQYKL